MATVVSWMFRLYFCIIGRTGNVLYSFVLSLIHYRSKNEKFKLRTNQFAHFGEFSTAEVQRESLYRCPAAKLCIFSLSVINGDSLLIKKGLEKLPLSCTDQCLCVHRGSHGFVFINSSWLSRCRSVFSVFKFTVSVFELADSPLWFSLVHVIFHSGGNRRRQLFSANSLTRFVQHIPIS